MKENQDKEVPVEQIKINPINPRELSEFSEGKLIESILIFPKMLKLRPILIDEENIALGGNQRAYCLTKIINLSDEEIVEYMFNQKKYRMMDAKDQEGIQKFWKKWKKKPVAWVRPVVGLSEEEKKELLVKDNMHYGEDDTDVMKKHFDREMIHDIIGTVPWTLYDYDDKINDEQIEKVRTVSQKFSCGYVSAVITDEELSLLNQELDAYLAEHEGGTDGFLMHLLSL